jgi:hypothetical protein
MRRKGARMADAAETIWVCEKGHADDHHYLGEGVQLCSRCGGLCLGIKLDGLARIAAEQLNEAGAYGHLEEGEG